jgi:hypothetical protein
MKRSLFPALIVVGLVASAPPAAAQYQVRGLDFDLWCTEEEHIPYERCAKRLPDDMQKFEAYRAIIERYEIEYLQEKDRKLHFDRYIMRNDPVERTKEPVPQTPAPPDGKSP